EQRVLTELSACDRVRNQRPRRPLIGEEGRLPERDVLRLVVHVLTTSRQRGTEDTEKKDRRNVCASATLWRIHLGVSVTPWLIQQPSSRRAASASRGTASSSRDRTSHPSLRCTERSDCGWPARTAAR